MVSKPINVRESLVRFCFNSLDRLTSKKFISWVVASAALFTGFLESDNWMMITMLYMGAQTVLDWRNPILSKGVNVLPTPQVPAQESPNQSPAGPGSP